MTTCIVCKNDVAFIPYAGRRDERCPICRSLRRHRDNFTALERSGAFDLSVKSPLLMVSIDPYWRRLEKHFDVTVLVKQHGIHNTTYGDICRPPFKPKSFSVVIASHVLEHVHNDAKAVAIIFQLLAVGGIFISNVPCGVSPITDEFGKTDPTQHGHWRLYGRESYKELLTRTGFRHVENVVGTAFAAKRLK